MFADSAGCQIVGTGYTSKHNRFSLSLFLSGGEAGFRAAFTDVAAYSDERHLLGKFIVDVEIVLPIKVITCGWDRVLRADIAGFWPGPHPENEIDAAVFASSLGLHGYIIKLENEESGWVLSNDYILLGRKPRA